MQQEFLHRLSLCASGRVPGLDRFWRTRLRAPQRRASPGILIAVRALQVAIIFVGATFLLGVGPNDARFENLGHKLMCRCGCNQILLECNHVGCSYSEKMRQELLAGVRSPDSDDLVLQQFVQEYGEVVLAAPTSTGFNRVAWITPFAVLGAGILAVVCVVRRWKSRPPSPPAVSTGGTVGFDEFRQRAREETEL
jgi:cytochrome c-type biogenesis protein CcmH